MEASLALIYEACVRALERHCLCHAAQKETHKLAFPWTGLSEGYTALLGKGLLF